MRKDFQSKKFPDDRQGSERIPKTGPSKYEALGLSPQPLKIAWLQIVKVHHSSLPWVEPLNSGFILTNTFRRFKKGKRNICENSGHLMPLA